MENMFLSKDVEACQSIQLDNVVLLHKVILQPSFAFITFRLQDLKDSTGGIFF